MFGFHHCKQAVQDWQPESFQLSSSNYDADEKSISYSHYHVEVVFGSCNQLFCAPAQYPPKTCLTQPCHQILCSHFGVPVSRFQL